MRKAWKKSIVCRRGSESLTRCLSSEQLLPSSCTPTAARTDTVTASTGVRLARAPTELPMVLMSVFRVGHGLAGLKTRSCRGRYPAEGGSPCQKARGALGGP